MLTAATGDTILLAFNMAWAGKHVYTRMQPFFRKKKNTIIFRSFILEVEFRNKHFFLSPRIKLVYIS